MEVNELRENCRDVMRTHLQSVGFPDLTRRQILNELPTMWTKLESAGLVEPLKELGWTYEAYCECALKKAQESAIFEHLSYWAQGN